MLSIVSTHTATHCNTLQHTATHCSTLPHTAAHCHALQHCNTLLHIATHCNTIQHSVTHCNTLQHTATPCNTLQHTATHCNTSRVFCRLCLPCWPPRVDNFVKKNLKTIPSFQNSCSKRVHFSKVTKVCVGVDDHPSCCEKFGSLHNCWHYPIVVGTNCPCRARGKFRYFSPAAPARHL